MAKDESKDGADSEVLSFGMTDRDDTEEPQLEEPHLTPSTPDPGFDGWLDGEENPYEGLEGGAAEEVADWIAFARGEADEEEEESEPPSAAADLAPEDADDEGLWAGEGDPPAGYDIKGNTDSMLYHRPDSWMFDAAVAEVWFSSEAAAIAAGFAPSPTHPGAAEEVEEEEREEPGSAPAAELPQEPGESEPDEEEEDTSEFRLPTFEEDTGEIPVGAEEVEVEDDLDAVAEMPAIKLGEEPVEHAADEEEEPEQQDLTEEDYLGAATQDHAELAAAIAAAELEATEKVALSAQIPGLESGVVGFEDVVEEREGEEEEVEEPDSSNLVLRVGTALTLVAALGLSLLWRPALIVFVLAVFVVSAGEFYSALIQHRFKPMSLFGFLGIAAAALGTAAWDVRAIPISLAIMATVVLLFSAVSHRRDEPAANFSLTVLVAAWIGGLGAFAFDIIAADDYQVLIISLVAMVALVDIAAYFVGRRIGRRPMSPVLSPKKTVEGLVAGTLTALGVGAIIGYLVDPIDLPTGLILGAVVAVFAPIGDLAVSVVKRSLDIKDMGSILPGHGGLLDRIDAFIGVIPAVWVVLTWLDVI